MIRLLTKISFSAVIIAGLNVANATITGEANRIYIFVSFSMPDKSLQGWMQDANKINAPLIIRGLYQNSLSATTKKVLNLLPNQRGGLLLDPTLFKRFNIDKVPAVLVTTQSCLDDRTCDRYDLIYGDVTLHYALEEIKDITKEKSRSANETAFIDDALNKLEE